MDTNTSQTEQWVSTLKDSYLDAALRLLLNQDGSLNHVQTGDSLHSLIIPKANFADIDESDIEKFRNKGKDLNQQDCVLQNTPLHLAAWLNKVDIMGVLLQYKADPNRENRDGFTALDIAVKRGHLNSIRCLLEHDPTPNNINKVLKRSVSNAQLEIVQYLIEAHQIQNEWIINILTNPLSLPVIRTGELKQQSQVKRQAIIQYLLDNVDIIQTPENTRYDIFEIAICYELIETVKNFATRLGNTFDPDLKNANGRTILELAFDLSKRAITKYLLDCGAKLIIPHNNYRDTILHKAVLNNNQSMVQFLLLECSIDPNIPNTHGDTALHIAAQKGNSWFVECALKHPKIDVTLQEKTYGNTPLHTAAAYGHLAIVEYLHSFLLKHGIDLDTLRTNENRTALHVATAHGKLDVVQYLLKNGAKLEMESERGYNTFHYAAFYAQPHVLQNLIDYLLASENYTPQEKLDLITARDKFNENAFDKAKRTQKTTSESGKEQRCIKIINLIQDTTKKLSASSKLQSDSAHELTSSMQSMHM